MISTIGSKKTISCCVPGCHDMMSKRHRFPFKASLKYFEAWVKAVNNPKISNLTPKEIYDKHYVCDLHFLEEDKVPGTKRGLKLTAVPKLNLSQSLREDIMSTDISRDEPRFMHSGGVSQSIMEVESLPSTSTGLEPTSGVTQTRFECPPEEKQAAGMKRRKILTQVNVSRQAQLTPKAKRLYRMMSGSCRRIASLEKQVHSFRKRLFFAEKLADSEKFREALKDVNEPSCTFILCQLRNQKLPKRARRFTLEEKILCLSLFKSSGRGYRLLSKLFALPSRKTLITLLNKIPSTPGINEKIFDTLREQTARMTDKERCCILIFDEMSVSCNLSYDQKLDKINGIEDDGYRRQPKLADHVNVFMLKGCFKAWKQPISYTFSSGPIKSNVLESQIKDLIRKCFGVGFIVVATICDQGSANQAAINGLLRETEAKCLREGIENSYVGFLIDEKEIIPIYDPPHLFKGIRNNLLTKDLYFSLKGQDLIAKWSHIQQFYYLDVSEEYRICPKLTDEHVLPEKINKMKVSACMQVFSHQVGSLMLRISQWGLENVPVKFGKEAGDTAKLILFLDELFDSLNGHLRKAPTSKPLKGGVTENSPHESFWRESLQVLRSMRFYSNEQHRFVANPSIRNLITTIRNFIYLKEVLLKKFKFRYILPRVFNQDSLENFFSCIRSHGVRNVSPDVSHFISSFKSLIINNFMSSHSPGANCEKDFSSGALNNLHFFLTNDENDVRPLVDEEIAFPDIPKSVVIRQSTKISSSIVTYISGYFVRKILNKFSKDCMECKSIFLSSDSTDTDVISARQYRESALIRPGTFIVFLVRQISRYLFYLLPRFCHFVPFKAALARKMNEMIDMTPIKCSKHQDMPNKFCKFAVKCIIFFWTKQVNRIAKGKDSKFVKFVSMSGQQSSLIDPIKLEALKKIKRSRSRH